MQLELCGKACLLDVALVSFFVEGREGRSFKQVETVGCFEDLLIMADNGVQSSRKASRVETKSWQELLYRKNDSAIIAHKEKRLKREEQVSKVLLDQDPEAASFRGEGS